MLLARAGEGGGNDSNIVKEGASFCIFMLTTPWSGSNLNKLKKYLTIFKDPDKKYEEIERELTLLLMG